MLDSSKSEFYAVWNGVVLTLSDRSGSAAHLLGATSIRLTDLSRYWADYEEALRAREAACRLRRRPLHTGQHRYDAGARE